MRIAHCKNEGAAQKLSEFLKTVFPLVNIDIHKCLGLCSYYAEKGGLLIAYEKA